MRFPHHARRRVRHGLAAASLSLLLSVTIVPAAAGAAAEEPGDPGTAATTQQWEWPVHPFRLERPFVAPPHRYGPGHRGIDLAPTTGDDVRAPAAGVVAFVGPVAGRGVLTIDHGDGLVSSFEPVASVLQPGTLVAAGDVVAQLTTGGHVDAGVLHFGVRLDGEYVNPMLLLGGIPRAILLPCC